MPQESHDAAIRAAYAATAIEDKDEKAAVRASECNDRNTAIFKGLQARMSRPASALQAVRTSYPLYRIANGSAAAICDIGCDGVQKK